MLLSCSLVLTQSGRLSGFQSTVKLVWCWCLCAPLNWALAPNKPGTCAEKYARLFWLLKTPVSPRGPMLQASLQLRIVFVSKKGPPNMGKEKKGNV